MLPTQIIGEVVGYCLNWSPFFFEMGIPAVIKAIGNNEERKEITARRHKILTWKTLSNKER
jgi:hypothetical protein